MAYVVKSLLDASVRRSVGKMAQQECLRALDALMEASSGHDTFIHFFPGITTSLLSLIIADYKLGSSLRIQATALWTKVAIEMLSDVYNRHLLIEAPSTSRQIDPQKSADDPVNTPLAEFRRWTTQHKLGEEGVLTAPRSPRSINAIEADPFRSREWAISTTIRVHQVLQEVCKHCQCSASASVREQIVVCSSAFLLSCLQTFSLSITPKLLQQHGPFAPSTLPALLLDVIISGLEDDYVQVATASRAELAKLELELSKLPGNPWARIQAGLGHALFTKIRALPRLARAANERELVVALRSGCSHIVMLGKRCRAVFEVSFANSLESMLQAFEISTYAQEAVVQFDVPDEARARVGYPSKQYVFVTDAEAVQAVRKFARYLGRAYAGICPRLLEVVVNSFSVIPQDLVGDEVEIVSEKRLPALLNLANEAVLGAADGAEEVKAELMALMETYLEIPMLQAEYSREGEEVIDQKEPVDGKTERWLVAMALEGLGNWAEAARKAGMEARELRRRLVKLLFPVLQHIGDRNALVHGSSVATLQRLATLCEYCSIADLLQSNLDYILDSVLQRLENIELFPTMPYVVEAVVKYAQIEASVPAGGVGIEQESKEGNFFILPFITDLVTKLQESLRVHRNSRGSLVQQLLRALGAIVGVFPVVEVQPQREVKSPLDRLVDELSTWKKTDFEFHDLDEGAQEKEDEEVGNDERDDADKSLHGESTEEDPYVILAEKILLSAQHFSLHGDLMVRRRVMTILSSGFKVLRRSEDKLLPLIHNVWPTVVATLKREQNLALLATSVHTIATSIESAGQFMQRRFLEDVKDPLLRILRNSSAENQKSLALVTAILDCLKTAAEVLPGATTVDHIETIVEASGRFLTKGQDGAVAESATQLFTVLCRKNPAAMWLEVAPFAIANTSRNLRYPLVAPHPKMYAIDELPQPSFLTQPPDTVVLRKLIEALRVG